ncbi:MAG: hypothetical protein ACYTEO_18005, partial [Planctomycetota bacterium]
VDIANRKYVVDAFAASVTMSLYTQEDSDTNNMLKAHAYLAVTDGFVVVVDATGAAGQGLKGYVHSTNDPAGAGTLVQSVDRPGLNDDISISFQVGSGEYFEITSGDTPSILWKSLGTLQKPIDQD